MQRKKLRTVFLAFLYCSLCTGYGNRIRAKYTAKWGVQIVGMIFQTRSR
ncbi:DUF6783 domain-containing protein [Blautia sp. HCP3S3_D9]